MEEVQQNLHKKGVTAPLVIHIKQYMPRTSPGRVDTSVGAQYKYWEDTPKPSGAPDIEERSWVKANTVPTGTTTISFRCRKPKITVEIMMQQIIRVTSPIHAFKSANTSVERCGKRQTYCKSDNEIISDNKRAASNGQSYINDSFFRFHILRVSDVFTPNVSCDFQATERGYI